MAWMKGIIDDVLRAFETMRTGEQHQRSETPQKKSWLRKTGVKGKLMTGDS